MARHAKTVNLNLGREKLRSGRPLLDRMAECDCKVCARLDTSHLGPATCGNGHALDARNCEDFKPANKERVLTGGILGVRLGYTA